MMQLWFWILFLFASSSCKLQDLDNENDLASSADDDDDDMNAVDSDELEDELSKEADKESGTVPNNISDVESGENEDYNVQVEVNVGKKLKEIKKTIKQAASKLTTQKDDKNLVKKKNKNDSKTSEQSKATQLLQKIVNRLNRKKMEKNVTDEVATAVDETIIDPNVKMVSSQQKQSNLKARKIDTTSLNKGHQEDVNKIQELKITEQNQSKVAAKSNRIHPEDSSLSETNKNNTNAVDFMQLNNALEAPSSNNKNPTDFSTKEIKTNLVNNDNELSNNSIKIQEVNNNDDDPEKISVGNQSDNHSIPIDEIDIRVPVSASIENAKTDGSSVNILLNEHTNDKGSNDNNEKNFMVQNNVGTEGQNEKEIKSNSSNKTSTGEGLGNATLNLINIRGASSNNHISVSKPSIQGNALVIEASGSGDYEDDNDITSDNDDVTSDDDENTEEDDDDEKNVMAGNTNINRNIASTISGKTLTVAFQENTANLGNNDENTAVKALPDKIPEKETKEFDSNSDKINGPQNKGPSIFEKITGHLNLMKKIHQTKLFNDSLFEQAAKQASTQKEKQSTPKHTVEYEDNYESNKLEQEDEEEVPTYITNSNINNPPQFSKQYTYDVDAYNRASIPENDVSTNFIKTIGKHLHNKKKHHNHSKKRIVIPSNSLKNGEQVEIDSIYKHDELANLHNLPEFGDEDDKWSQNEITNMHQILATNRGTAWENPYVVESKPFEELDDANAVKQYEGLQKAAEGTNNAEKEAYDAIKAFSKEGTPGDIINGNPEEKEAFQALKGYSDNYNTNQNVGLPTSEDQISHQDMYQNKGESVQSIEENFTNQQATAKHNTDEKELLKNGKKIDEQLFMAKEISAEQKYDEMEKKMAQNELNERNPQDTHHAIGEQRSKSIKYKSTDKNNSLKNINMKSNLHLNNSSATAKTLIDKTDPNEDRLNEKFNRDDEAMREEEEEFMLSKRGRLYLQKKHSKN